MKKIIKSHKPIDTDVHLKYRCENCSIDHWISLRQAKVKNYKIICDCNTIIIPKKIDSIKIIFHKKPKKISTKILTIDTNLLESCSSILIDYGFTKSESIDLIKQAYVQNPTNNISELVKFAIKNIGENNVKLNTTNIV